MTCLSKASIKLNELSLVKNHCFANMGKIQQLSSYRVEGIATGFPFSSAKAGGSLSLSLSLSLSSLLSLGLEIRTHKILHTSHFTATHTREGESMQMALSSVPEIVGVLLVVLLVLAEMPTL